VKGHRIAFIGRLGGDPDAKLTPSGIAVTTINVATTEKLNKEAVPNCPDGWKDSYNGKGWELTTWFRCTAWRGLAEVINQYSHKGDEVYIEGRLSGDKANGTQNPRVWQGKDGTYRASFELTIDSYRMLGSSSDGSGGGNGHTPDEPPPGMAEDNEIPF